jgi:SAM-dependent methyltransferase
MLLGSPSASLLSTPGPNDYGTPAQSPYSSYSTPSRTKVKYTERRNVRFEIQDVSQGLDYPDSVFDIVHCRYVLTLGVCLFHPGLLQLTYEAASKVPDFGAAVQELLRVLRPGGLLLMAESSVPFCLSVGLYHYCYVCLSE